MTSSQACRPFLPENGIVIPVKKHMITSQSIYVLIRVNYAIFQTVLLFRGFPVLIAIVFLKVRNFFDQHKQNLGKGKSICAFLVIVIVLSNGVS